MAAKESGLALDFLQDMDEKHPHSLLYSLCVGRPNLVLGNCNISVERMASKAQREAVLHVAGQGSCVIVGRGADYILRNETRLFRVFVSAGMDFRIQRVVKRDGITEDEPVTGSGAWTRPGAPIIILIRNRMGRRTEL